MKLNDRNIHTRRESGFTFYVVISAVLLTLYGLLDSDSLGLIIDSNTNQSLVVSIVFNLVVFLVVVVYMLWGISISSYEGKSLSSLEETALISSVWPRILFLGFISLVNFHFWSRFGDFSSMFFKYNAIFYSTIVLVTIFAMALNRRVETIETDNEKKRWIRLVIVFLVFLVPIFYLIYIGIHNIKLDTAKDDVVLAIRVAAFGSGFFIGIIKIVEMALTKRKHNWLLNLEKEIVLNDIDAEAIKTKLENYYFSQDQ